MAPDLVPADEPADRDGRDDRDDVIDAELLDGPGGGSDPAGPDLGSLLGGLDMGSLFGAASEMQQQMLAAQEAAAHAEYEGQSGGGVVRVVVTGSMEFRSVTLAPEVVDPDDVDMLQDLILAALHDAVGQAVSAAAATAMPGMDLLGGLDLGGLDLGSLLGGAPGDDALDDELDDDDTGAG